MTIPSSPLLTEAKKKHIPYTVHIDIKSHNGQRWPKLEQKDPSVHMYLTLLRSRPVSWLQPLFDPRPLFPITPVAETD